MRKIAFIAGAIALSLATNAAVAKDCAMHGKAGCPFMNPKASFNVSEKDGKLVVTAVTHGCAGMRAAFQDSIEECIARAKAGKAGKDCPFGVKGIKTVIERTELGATLTVTGPDKARAEFKKRLDAKLAARAASPRGHDDCGCGHHRAD